MAQHVTAHHLTRLACLDVRQSTLQQVLENTESTSRQYALRERARALGWADERIVVIDQDLGHSGASTVDRLAVCRREQSRSQSSLNGRLCILPDTGKADRGERGHRENR